MSVRAVSRAWIDDLIRTSLADPSGPDETTIAGFFPQYWTALIAELEAGLSEFYSDPRVMNALQLDRCAVWCFGYVSGLGTIRC